MHYKDLEHKPALNRLVKLALRCDSYSMFESQIIGYPRFYLRTPGLRRWSKDTLKKFFELRNQMTELERIK